MESQKENILLLMQVEILNKSDLTGQ